MRKVLVGLVVICGVVVVGAFGAYKYVQNRALNEVDSVFAALRANGAMATHGPATFDVWTRQLVIDDVAIKPAGSGPGTTTIKKISADRIDLFASEFAASRIEVTSIEVDTPMSGSPDARSTMKVPQLIASNVRSNRLAAAANDKSDVLKRVLALYAGLRADTIVAPTLTLALSLPPAPSPRATSTKPLTIDYLYSNVKIEALGDGKIKQASFDKVDINSGAAATAPLISGTIGKTTVSDLDILPVFGMGLASRTPKNGYYAIQGKVAMGGYALKLQDGAEVVVDSMSGGGFGIDPAKISYEKLQELMALLPKPGEKPSPAQGAAFARLIGDYYAGIQMGSVDVRGFRMTGPKTQPNFKFGIAAVAMSGLEQGRLQEFRIDGVEGGAKPGSGAGSAFKLGSFVLQGFDIAGLLRKSADLSEPNRMPVTADKALQLLAVVEGIEVSGLSMPDPRTGQQINIEALKMAWGRFINGLPSNASWNVKALVPINPTDPSMALLRNTGLTEIGFASESQLDWVEPEQRVRSKSDIDVARVAVLSTRMSLGKVTREAFSIAPGQFAAKLPDMEVGPIEITLKDDGFVELYRKAMGLGATDDPVAAMRQQLVDPAKPDTKMAALLDGASRFMAAPGQTISLKLAPLGNGKVADLMTPGQSDGTDLAVTLLDKFNLDINVAR